MITAHSLPERHPNRSARLLRAGIVAFLTLTVARVWLGSDPIDSQAQAQLPNPAAQRLEAVQEMRQTNELLTEIRDLLKKGTLHVRLEGADNQSDASIGPRGAGR